jgi:hypothetical protein
MAKKRKILEKLLRDSKNIRFDALVSLLEDSTFSSPPVLTNCSND